VRPFRSKPNRVSEPLFLRAPLPEWGGLSPANFPHGPGGLSTPLELCPLEEMIGGARSPPMRLDR